MIRKAINLGVKVGVRPLVVFAVCWMLSYLSTSTVLLAATPQVVTIGDQPLYLPSALILAAVKRDPNLFNFLLEQNFALRWVPFAEGESLRQAYQNKEIQGGVAGDMPLLRIVSHTQTWVAVMVQQGYTSVVAYRPMLLHELRGKRMAVIYGSNAHYTLLRALQVASLDDQSVTLIPMDFEHILSGYVDGKIEGFSAWEPTVTLISNQRQNSFRLFRRLGTGYFFLTREFQKSQPSVALALVRSLSNAICWIGSDSEHMLRASRWALEDAQKTFGAKLTDVSIEQMAQNSRQDLFAFPTNGLLSFNLAEEATPLKAEFDLLKTKGFIPKEVLWDVVLQAFERGTFQDPAGPCDSEDLFTELPLEAH